MDKYFQETPSKAAYDFKNDPKIQKILRENSKSKTAPGGEEPDSENDE
jgi:hypothetical protein